MKLLREYVNELLTEQSESVTFREVESPLVYRGGGPRRRFALCYSSVTEPPEQRDTYFKELERWRRRTPTGRKLKEPKLIEVIPGVSDVCITGFLDFHQRSTTKEGKPYWYIDYMKTRGDMRGQKISSRLVEEFFKKYAEPGSVVDFGQMLEEQVVHLKQKMEKKYPNVKVLGDIRTY